MFDGLVTFMDRMLWAKKTELSVGACLVLSDEIFAQLPKQWLDFKLTQTLFMTFPQEWHLHMFKYARPHLLPH